MTLEQLTLKEFKTILEQTAHHRESLFQETRQTGAWSSSLDNPRLDEAWREIRDSAERYASIPMNVLPYSKFTGFHSTGDRAEYEADFTDRTKRMHVFAIMLLAEGSARWRTLLEDTLWEICNLYTWVLPAHVGLYHNDYPDGIWDQPEPPRETVDLAAASIAFAMAEIVDLLGDKLTWVVHRMKQEIDRRIFGVYFYDPVPQNWELKTNNWPAVCASGIGIAAQYLIKDSELLAGMLWRVLNALKSHLNGFDHEGATSEGIAYWQYGFGHFEYFAELLRERTNGQVDLLADARVRQIARFSKACFLSEGRVLNFSDASDSVELSVGLFERLKARDPEIVIPHQPLRAKSFLDSWPHLTRTLLWTGRNEPGNAAGNDGTNEDFYFEGHQWAIAKSYRGDKLYAFAAKGGHNQEPHNHNDLGHFIIHAAGVDELADFGAGQYTRQYFQPKHRYQLINCGSHGHSVPIVDGCLQQTGRQYHVAVLKYEACEEDVTYRLDLTKAYDCSHLDRLERHFHWRRAKNASFELILTDVASFSKQPESFTEVFCTKTAPELISPGIVRIGGVTLYYDADDRLDIDSHPMETKDKTSTVYRLLFNVMRPDMQVAKRFRIICDPV